MSSANVKRGLFVGRFNPFHLGHLQAVEDILRREDEIIIAIGSTQQSHTFTDPFTAGERVLMIHEALKEAKISLDKVFIVTVPDIFRNPVWVSHLRSYCPPFTRVYTSNSHTRRLFEEAGIEVKSTELHNRANYKGSEIRKLMFDGLNWQKMVPKAVQEVIISIDGIKRVKNTLNHTD